MTSSWINLRVLPGWKADAVHPPQARFLVDGATEIRGLVTPVGEKKGPQVRLPKDMIPEIEGEKLVHTYFTLGYLYPVDPPVWHEPEYGPRVTFFKNGDVLVEPDLDLG